MSHAHYGSGIKGLELAPIREYRALMKVFEVRHSHTDRSAACIVVEPCRQVQDTHQGRSSYGRGPRPYISEVSFQNVSGAPYFVPPSLLQSHWLLSSRRNHFLFCANLVLHVKGSPLSLPLPVKAHRRHRNASAPDQACPAMPLRPFNWKWSPGEG